MDEKPSVKTFVDNLNPLPVGTHLQEFVVEKLVGIGGFGIVYRANDTLLGRSVAIKEYMPTSMASRQDGATVSVRSEAYTQDFESGKRSFINEARMLARFKHSALIEVFRFWEQNGTAYMATPFYEGQTFKERLQDKDAKLPDESSILKTLQPILDALETMHAEQIFHRDISPDNIMVLPDGRPILLDLGAARKVMQEGAQALTVMVKPGYAPIEQYADDSSIKQGPWTDIYALGAVIHFAITGKAPPPAASRLLKDSMPNLRDRDLPGFTSAFLAAADAALRVRPEDRPQSIAEFRKLLTGELLVSPVQQSSVASNADLADATDSSGPHGTMPQATKVAELADVVEPIDSDHTIVLPRTVTKSMLAATDKPIAVPKKSNVPKVAAIVAALGLLSAGYWVVSEPTPPKLSQPVAAPPVVPVVPVVPAAVTAPAVEPIKPVEAPVLAPIPEAVVDEVKKPVKLAVVKLSIKPWGEVFVEGASKGISPPLKSLSLPAGDYVIEIRNGDFAPYTTKLTLKSGEANNLTHAFSDTISPK
jgi:serine/threonine protein kinase